MATDTDIYRNIIKSIEAEQWEDAWDDSFQVPKGKVVRAYFNRTKETISPIAPTSTIIGVVNRLMSGV